MNDTIYITENVYGINYTETAATYPGWACGVCGATITTANREKHTSWHDILETAIQAAIGGDK